MNWFSKMFGGQKGVAGHKEATTVEIHGHPLKCRICRHPYFWRHEVQLNTQMASFFGVEWMNSVATCAVCDHCGYIHWFLPPQDRHDEQSN
jgi:hypothetical protein